MPAKDHLTLIDAFAIVARRLPEAELHLAGNGPLRERIEARVAALNLGNRITLHGPLFDMPAYLSGLDAFVLSSLTEGLPIAILEAMAAGLPIVSTRVAGVPEAAPEGTVARYAPLSDPAALAEAMVATAEDPSAAKKGQAGRDLVQSEFTIERMWKEHEALFASLLPRAAVQAA